MSSDSNSKTPGSRPRRDSTETARDRVGKSRSSKAPGLRQRRDSQSREGPENDRTVEANPVDPAAIAAANETSSRILVVDDSPTFCRAIAEMLEAEGYKVDTAFSGEEAFEVCLSTSYEVIVSDITMGALSGFQLCRLLRSDPSTKDMPVVLLTAADDPRSRFWGRHAGAAAYVAKEHARDELVDEVKRVLERGAVSMIPVATRAARRLSLMERLSAVLDELLFRAVVSSEVQLLTRHASDRQQFARVLASLASEVADYSYLALRLDGADGDTYTIHALGPWPEENHAGLWTALGISADSEPTVDVIIAGATLPAGSDIQVRDEAHFPIVAAGETLGDLRAFGASRRLGGEDRTTLELIAQQSALLVKNMRLLEETRRLANSDGLTGLQNRRRSTERLDTEIGRARRFSVPLSVAMVDLDHFKGVNDRYGHNIGDDVLKEVAKALSSAVRTVDLVGRWGGEEFFALLSDTDAAGAKVVAERMRASVADLPPFQDGPEKITCSVGVATFAGEANGVLFVDRADRALYQAKEEGRNRVTVADDPANPADADAG